MSNKPTPEQIVAASRVVADRDELIADGSLSKFMVEGWPALEPGVKFVSGWAVDAICEHLEAVSRGEIRRLLINVPPGCTKSMTVNVFWPAWEWANLKRRHHRYISISHEENLSMRDLVRCRDLVQSEWYRKRWPVEIKADQNAKGNYVNTMTGWRYASSVGAGLTGYRGDRLLVDDPNSPKGAESEAEREAVLRWFAETLPTRLNNLQESAIVVIMQRVHERDVSGLILSEGLGYTHLCLPMEYDSGHPFRWKKDPRKKDGELLWPERFARESVENLKADFRSWGGVYAEAGQLQQLPVPRGGGMFKADCFQMMDMQPMALRRVRGWDLAGSKDGRAAYTAGCLMSRNREGRIVIEDMVRFRGTPGEVREKMRRCAEVDGLKVEISCPQDPGQAGKAQRADIASCLHGYNVHFSPETGSKEDRATPLAVQVENGNVFLKRGGWNHEFLEEAKLFPMGRYKDQIDAATRAYQRLITRRDRTVASRPRVFVDGEWRQ